MSQGSQRTLGFLPWGDLIEDYLDPLGLTLEQFCTRMQGGWFFGYIDALARVGVRCVVICVSRACSRATRFTHEPTGATVWALPPGPGYLALRTFTTRAEGLRLGRLQLRLRRLRGVFARRALPYLATPIGALQRVLRDEGCQALLCQEYEYARFDVCALARARLGVPVYATFQGGRPGTGWLERALRTHAMRRCAGLVIATQAERERVAARYRAATPSLRQVHNPMALEAWTREPRLSARAALGLDPQAQLVLWHGRLALHTKGLDLLLEAFRQVRAARPSRAITLVLVGSGPDLERVRRESATFPAGAIHLHAQFVLDRTLLQRFLSAADVYAFASRHEGSPVALVEALASGLPVAACAASGVRDLLDGTPPAGWVVPCGDSAALAEAIGGLLDDVTLAQRLARAGRARVEQAFAPARVGAALRQFLFSEPQLATPTGTAASGRVPRQLKERQRAARPQPRAQR